MINGVLKLFFFADTGGAWVGTVIIGNDGLAPRWRDVMARVQAWPLRGWTWIVWLVALCALATAEVSLQLTATKTYLKNNL